MATPEPLVDATCSPRFRTFDLVYDLDEILGHVRAPQAIVLIEDRPSTHYCLPLVIIVSRLTGDWYVFHRGRIAFEGTGGGLWNSRAIFKQLRELGVPASAYSLSRNVVDALETGQVNWPEVAALPVPVLAAPRDGRISMEIRQNVATIFAPAVGAI